MPGARGRYIIYESTCVTDVDVGVESGVQSPPSSSVLAARWPCTKPYKPAPQPYPWRPTHQRPCALNHKSLWVYPQSQIAHLMGNIIYATEEVSNHWHLATCTSVTVVGGPCQLVWHLPGIRPTFGILLHLDSAADCLDFSPYPTFLAIVGCVVGVDCNLRYGDLLHSTSSKMI